MLEKLKNKEPIKEPDLTTKPVAESQQGITPSPRKLNSQKGLPSQKRDFQIKIVARFFKNCFSYE